MEWNVPDQMDATASPTRASARSRISRAARFVKVSRRMRSGATPRSIR